MGFLDGLILKKFHSNFSRVTARPSWKASLHQTVMDRRLSLLSTGSTTGSFRIPSLELENGKIMESVDIQFCTYGALNPERNNAIMVCHSLTMNADVGSWWGKLLGPGRSFDTNKYFIVSANVIGSQWGSTGPTTVNPKTGKSYGPTFPTVTLRDCVRAHLRLFKEELRIQEVYCVIGASLGGMQALEWAIEGGTYVKRGIFLCAGPEVSAWQIAFHDLQRRAINQDPAFKSGHYSVDQPPLEGLSLAWLIAMLSFRSHGGYAKKFGELDEQEVASKIDTIHSYLEHQGGKFSSKFDANTYLVILKLVESHNVGRGRGGIEKALGSMIQPTLIIGVTSDILYPIAEQQVLHNLIPNSSLEIIDSVEGHDGFLIEAETINNLVSKFLNK